MSGRDNSVHVQYEKDGEALWAGWNSDDPIGEASEVYERGSFISCPVLDVVVGGTAGASWDFLRRGRLAS